MKKFPLLKDILERIRGSFEVSGNKELCEKLDWTYKTLNSRIDRNSIPYEWLEEVVSSENLSMDWILYGTSTSDLGYSSNVSTSSNKPHYNVRLIASSASAGHGEFALDSESDDFIQVSKNLFRTTPKEDNLRAVKIIGDSMIPMLQDGDVAIFCKGSTYDKEGLYIINKGNELFIKNLSVDLQNNLHVESANPAYKSFTVPFESQEYTFIIGKVLATVSSY